MKQMFVDISLSKELQNEFRSTKNNSSVIGEVEFTPEILTNGTWPLEAPPAVTVPRPLQACTESFTMFYKNKS